MDKIAKFSKTIRNNWKKSVFGVIALYYGGTKVKEKYQINVLMRAACKEAAVYGDALIPMDRNPTTITVILNPVANKRKAKQEFEKYCEPLLHLAGLQVNVIQTASEGNAKEIVETLHGTEAIIVAGGDGTLSETVTGLLRRNDGANQFPLGILPLGRTNTFGNSLFPGGQGVEKVKQLIDASMAIIEGNTTWKDAMKIEPIPKEDEVPNRPIYAMSSIECGAFRDTLAKRDKYWFCGPLREYASFLFNGYKESLTWHCSGTIRYTPPCIGCSNCIQKKPEIKRKWSLFFPSTQAAPQSDQTKQLNPECTTTQELCYKTCDLKIQTENKENQIPAINILVGKNTYSYTEFVAEGWNRLKKKRCEAHTIPVRTVELIPKDTANEVMLEIDKEEFEVKPVKITLLPKVIKLFCKPQLNV
ncbi:acylglycerol kinase, mitochondrial [Galleria mellonella]|uniref:Acylglycerol kinase, mitochondrial n=1 Tax=Galleria mellonella TaxID=7137 RepID=A0A6J1WF61_GALME|nr:acylglycerol kinase, mitochondrial [Galleria mellonella]